MPKYVYVLVCFLSLIATAFAEDTLQPQEEPEEKHLFVSEEGMEDPFEDWNRVSLKMNEGLDMLIFLPVIGLYNAMTPSIVREGVSNGLQNIASPFFMVNFLLQGEGQKAGRSLGRFIINSIFGLFGFFDVAEELGLPAEETTFGETIQRWGGQPGPYFVWPLLGPSCARDSFGLLFGFFLSPIDMGLLWKGKYDLVDAHVGLVFFETKVKYASTLENLRESSLDYYAVLRSLYSQKQSATLKAGHSSQEKEENDGPRPLRTSDQVKENSLQGKEDDGPRPFVPVDQKEKARSLASKEDDGPRPLALSAQTKKDPQTDNSLQAKEDDGPRPLAAS